MPKHILIATLGKHPAVVTGMVKALREFKKIDIDTLHVVHTEDTDKDIAEVGYPLIAEFLEDQCLVQPLPLPFSDSNTRKTSLTFLQHLAGLLSGYTDPACHHVHLSLAGGRKNMSALMALVTQFFPTVRGLYHLLDRRERQGYGFPSIEQIVLMPHEQQLRTLNPPIDHLKLVSIPYPGAFAHHSDLWQFLKTANDEDEQSPIPLPPEAELFFKMVAGNHVQDPQLEVRVTEDLIEDYRALGPQLQSKLIGYTRRMRYPQHLDAKASGPRGWETNCEVYPEHKAHAKLRIFYYWDRPRDTIILCRAMLHQEYDRKGTVWYQEQADTYPISALERDCVLLVPLGKTPMVATQTYTLLQESEEDGMPTIPAVAVLYPEDSTTIGKGVRMLRKQFRRRSTEFLEIPIPGLRDVDSEAACETYLEALLAAIEKLRDQYPDRELVLSLSGGRKEMSALSLFAAQRTGIKRLYHTLIHDPDLEEQIEDETTIKVLDGLSTDDDRAQRLFLDAYDREQFELFTVPVIPFSR